MKKTYHGSCHCGAVRYEADIDFAEGTGKCNCTYCIKLRLWGVHIRPDALRMLAGEDALTVYRFNTQRVEHPFCRHCGVHVFDRGNIPEVGGAFVTVNIACLDDAELQGIIEAPLRYFDGRTDNWMNPPAETRHL